MKRFKKHIIIVLTSVFLLMGFTNSGNTTSHGQYQSFVFQDRLMMMDTHTARVYEYDFDFNHWRELTFGNHIIGH